MHNQKEEELKIKCWAESTSSLAKYNGIVCIFEEYCTVQKLKYDFAY